MYPAKPSYSHCVKLGRTDDHFSTAARVKKTVTPPTDKTVTVLALVSWRALVITVEPSPLKHGGQFVRALRCHQGSLHDCSLEKVALILSNAIFDMIMAAQLTEIDLHCCEKLAQRWVNTDDVGPLLIQHWTGTPNWDRIG